MALLLSDSVVNEPEVAFSPDQFPEAVQLVVLTEDQANLEVLPAVSVLGVAERVIVAAGTTVTVVDCETLPPPPLHESVYVLVALGDMTNAPDVALVPVHAPAAVQVVALVTVQDKELLLPEITVPGFADSVMIGALVDDDSDEFAEEAEEAEEAAEKEEAEDALEL